VIIKNLILLKYIAKLWKKNIYYRPWGSYTNLFKGKEFLIKELYVKPKGILSLQKHHHRAEHCLVTNGKPLITLNKDKFKMSPNEHIFIPLEIYT
jgi:mannose-6-phosphate isomerase-like protein (cupin superfamily)